MLYLAHPSEVPKRFDGTPASSGFRTVYKSEEEDRTIQDRRAANALERQVGGAARRLPHGCGFCELQLEASETLRAHKDDLPNCFHAVETTPERAASNAIGSTLPLRAFAGTNAATEYRARHPQASDRDRVFACNAALAMGDGNAVAFVQEAHVNMIDPDDAELVEYRRPVPRGSTWQSIMVDDHIVFSIVPRAAQAGFHRCDEVLAKALEAYATAGLCPKLSKSERGVEDFQAIGASVWGSRRWVSAALPGLLGTIAVSVWVIENRVATVGLFEGLVGCWVNALLYCRTAFALVRRMFTETQGVGESDVVFRPSAASLDELSGLVALAPVLGTDIGAPVETTISAVDASSHTAAIVAAEVAPPVARELWRVRERRGQRSPLAGRAEAWLNELRDGEDADERAIADGVDLLREVHAADERADEVAAPTWGAALAQALDWVETQRYRVSRGEHVNLKEARPIRTVVRQGIERCVSGPKRHMLLSDSSVNVGAWARGRSASPRLNGFLRDVSYEQIVVGFQVGVMKLETAHNPADDPTRGRQVRKSMGAPRWLVDLGRGDFALFDAELAADAERRALVQLPLSQFLVGADATAWAKVRREGDLEAVRAFAIRVRDALGGIRSSLAPDPPPPSSADLFSPGL